MFNFVAKSLEKQAERTREKAEVFTPSWICNKMNNHCDAEWFGRENVFNDDRFPEIHEWIDALTTFDANERMKKSPNLFALAHKLREEVNAQGFRDVNTDFLWNQLNEYGKRSF